MHTTTQLISKVFSILLIFIFSFALSNAQNHEILEIKQLPGTGILLDKAWKFQLGDNPEWSGKGYNDITWQTINPTPDIHDIPILWKDSIVWFRLHFKVDTSIIGQLALMIQQSVASEIYLNDRLIKRFGVVSKNPKEIVAFDPAQKPLSLPIIDASPQVLAVRCVLEPHIRYCTNWGSQNRGLYIRLLSLENAKQEYFRTLTYNDKSLSFRIGVFVILGILYLVFYLSYRSQKINLQFSIYAFIQAAGWWTYFHNFNDSHEVRYWFYYANFQLVFMAVGWYFLLSAVYNLLGQKKSWIFYCVCILGLISIPMGIFIYGWGWMLYAVFFTDIAFVEITRIAFNAVRQHKKGAWTIAVGAIASLFFWTMFTFSYFFDLPTLFNRWDVFNLTHLSIPVAVAIYLGYDFALTNRSLQQKITEIQHLSEEKNQILSTQNEMLEKQVTERTADLKESLNNLKATQAQLIQSEKMASLGELTAGIAHEIQNPLNFVNNFSEVNKELLTELKDGIEKGNLGEVKAIASSIIDNEEKISHHGKRADAIVKGMLQHSQISSGQKEPTDINALCDEYLRLAYHGLRAKDKSFNAILQTHFDPSIGKVNVIPQEIGRVLLNLYNNAFYAVTEKKKHEVDAYEPTISVSTEALNGKLQITVKDNGNGIPEKIKDKIFQPFFTTKPAGQGTGLGLSLSYDIVKVHGGEIKLETKEGKGSEFVIQLPVV